MRPVFAMLPVTSPLGLIGVALIRTLFMLLDQARARGVDKARSALPLSRRCSRSPNRGQSAIPDALPPRGAR